MKLVRVLHHRDFALLWGGQALSNVGNSMFPVALALLVLDRAGAQGLGVVLAVQTLALGAGAVAAAALGDRWRRTRTMAGGDLMRMAAVAAIAAVPRDFPLAGVAGLVVVVGIGEGVFQPAFGAVVPKVVPDDSLQQANALTSFSVHTAAIFGPALAGVSTAAWGARATLWVDAATFLVSLGTLIGIREAAFSGGQARTAAPGLRGALRSTAGEVREGVAAVLARRWIAVTMASVTAVTMFAAAPTLVLLPIVARARLGGDSAYGAVLAAAGVGAVLGALVAARGTSRRPGLVAIGFSMLNAASMAGLALLPLPGVMVTWALAGLGVTAFNVLWVTALQRDVPEQVLGRVMALDWLGSTCFMPLGYLLAGSVAQSVGTRTLLLSATAITLVVTPLPLLSRGTVDFATAPAPTGGPVGADASDSVSAAPDPR
jgi:MFS family permease